MISQLEAILPTIIFVVVLLLVLGFVARFWKRLPEIFEDPEGKLSNKRVGALGFTAWVFAMVARGIEVPIEAWMLVGGLWALKTMQRFIEAGSGFEYEEWEDET